MSTRFSRAEAKAHGDGTNVDGPKSHGVLFGDEPPLFLPEFAKLFALGSVLQKNRSRSVGKSFAHPLIAITGKPTVCPHHWCATSCGVTIFQYMSSGRAEDMPLRVIEEAADGQINKHRPALTVVASGLLGDSTFETGSDRSSGYRSATRPAPGSTARRSIETVLICPCASGASSVLAGRVVTHYR